MAGPSPLPDEVRAFFESALPAAMPDHEARPDQMDMALRVLSALEDERTLLCEAGTGTGKSLAYLVPAALWAMASGKPVVVSTYTRALQTQLLSLDLPLLTKGGLPVKTAVLLGRSNYACKRRLGLAVDEDAALGAQDIAPIAAWEALSETGARPDLPLDVAPDVWERVLSDSDLTFGDRCPHYRDCRYYSARRAAAAAHVIVVNHALVLLDLHLRQETNRGILPTYRRLILDEAHHLEDAATGVVSAGLSALAVRRAMSPLQDSRRKGVLSRLVLGPGKRLPSADQTELHQACATVSARVDDAIIATDDAMDRLALDLPRDARAIRIQGDLPDRIRGPVESIEQVLDAFVDAVDDVTDAFEDIELPDVDAQPLLDLRRARARVAGQAQVTRAFARHADSVCRWVEAGRRNDAAIQLAPIDVGPRLRQMLWEFMPGTVATSATLSIAGNFSWWQQRHGVDEAEMEVFPSPFDYRGQSVLVLPRDLPRPADSAWWKGSAAAVADAVARSGGGAFVLCTSFDAVRRYARAIRQRLGRRVLEQGTMGRAVLLQRFRERDDSVLVGTDSFWEGVSVRGDALRLVIIPRLPFRVPTEPLRMARHDALKARGLDPFRAMALPEATLKLRQGFGRLIRARDDRGTVVLLDGRIHDHRYGRAMLRALPPARRAVGPWERVLKQIDER